MKPSPLVLILVLLVSAISSHVWAQRKEEFKSFFRIMNVPYTEDRTAKANMLDVYMPKKGSKSPVIIWVNGSNWIVGDKSDIDKKPEYFTAKGYIFIAVNYRLAPQAQYTTQAQDVANAIVWVYENIIHYSGDKNKISVVAHGTGAHIAAMVSVQDKYLKNANGSLQMIKCVVALEAAGFDIPTLLPLSGNKFKEGCELAIGKTRKQWVEASPVTYVQAETTMPPFLIAYAGVNTPAETDANIFAFRLNREKLPNKLIGYPDKKSQAIYRDFGKEGDKVTEDVVSFLYENLK